MSNYSLPNPFAAGEIYVQNRCDFYTFVKERLRNKGVLRAVWEIVEPIQVASDFTDKTQIQKPLVLSDYESALLLRDIYKKPQFGQQRAKTVLSVGDLLQTSQDVEEAGLLLFRHLTHLGEIAMTTYRPLEQFHEVRLFRLIELADQLRYHRMRLA